MLNLRKLEYENYFKAKRKINIKPSLEINPDILDVDISMPIEDVNKFYPGRFFIIY
jgi:hypothetical protein